MLLASYPRSGNTWIRSILSYVLAGINGDPDMHSFDRLVKYTPDIYVGKFENNSEPRIIKTHSHYLPCFSKIRKCVYVCRDGRDIAVSYYYYKLMTDKSYYAITFSDYLLYVFLGQGDMFSPWQESVKSWLFNPSVKDTVLVVKYEDLLKSPLSEFKRIIEYLDFSCAVSLLEEAVSVSSFEKLQKKEKKEQDQFHEAIMPGAKSDNNIAFFRKGKVGSYKEIFSKQDIFNFDMYCGDLMKKLGYDRY